MGNAASKIFTTNGNFVAPAGVTQVTVVSKVESKAILPNTAEGFPVLMLDPFGNMYGMGSGGSVSIDGTTNNYSSPILVAAGFKFISTPYRNNNISIGAIGKDGAIYTWGDNTFGNLGLGDVTSRSIPTKISSPIGFTYLTTYCGGTGTPMMGAISELGQLYTWGANSAGQLGVGDTVDRSSPTAVVGGQLFNSFQNYNSTAMGITPSGAMYAWGQNQNGQLGIGTQSNTNSPQIVLGGLTFAKLPVYSGITNNPVSFGITTSGDLYAWGTNTSGILGTNQNPTTTLAASSPIAVVGGLKWQSVYQCNLNAWGITTSGDLYGWGVNNSGQIGDGTLVTRSSPVLVVGGLKWKAIYPIGPAGNTGQTVLGLTTSGQAYAWGTNTDGQLGDGTVVAKSSPVAVLGGLTFTQLGIRGDTPDFSCFGVTANGQVYGWGYNGQGQLGNGNLVSRSSPVAVVGGFAAQVSGYSYSVTIPVIPGTTYAVSMMQPNPTFGSQLLGNFIPSSVTVLFEG